MENKEYFIDGIICDINDLAVCSLIADRLKVPMWYIRKPKKHGLRESIEGDKDKLKQAKNVFLISKYINSETSHNSQKNQSAKCDCGCHQENSEEFKEGCDICGVVHSAD